MNRRVAFALALAFFPLASAPLFATDLSKIERTIAKEPAYKTKPKYCLLVFGPEAKHRVWLVQDGDTLYVDRNGNGDLTEQDERIASEKSEGDSGEDRAFKVRELRVGDRVHRELYVSSYKIERSAEGDKRAKAIVEKDPLARAYTVMIEVEIPGWKGTGIGGRVQHRASGSDRNGYFQFADRPQNAPIVHFDGPLEIAVGAFEFRVGREIDFTAGVGTRGLGPGTHTWIDYDGVIPEQAHPTVQILYPPMTVGEPPVRMKHELKERC
jgi:hypothetical protein